MSDAPNDRVNELERLLLLEFGPALRGASLRRLLGYTTANAFRQALHRRTVPVPLTMPPGASVWCAATRDVARWMATTESGLRSAPPLYPGPARIDPAKEAL
jgi:hypothetical protein